jgi:ATP-independent RNA helicase DbpA
MSISQFSDLHLNSDILKSLSFLGYEKMTSIQQQSLPEILNNKDVIGQAKTGSGKTASFAVGILSKLNLSQKGVQALVLCPTRELSEQVCKEIRKVASFIPNIKIASLCGGSPMQAQMSSLRGVVHCVVGTPGRILDHILKNSLNLDNLETLVFDEADRMLEMGFLKEISEIVSYVPKNRQTLLFSATYPEDIQNLSKNFQKDAVFVKADTDAASLNIEQLFFRKTNTDDFSLLTSLLAHYRPQSTLIFCNTKQKCFELAEQLQAKGHDVKAIHGDLEQRERDEALVLFSNHSLSILVATDVAARGLDIKDLHAVINFDLPHDPEVYVHRVGRTARAGKSGLALSLVSPQEETRLSSIEAYQDKSITIGNSKNLVCTDPLPLLASHRTLRISCGRKNKLRAADILGALTAAQAIEGQDVGKIDICDFHSFVAIERTKIELALKILTDNKIKGRFLKVALMS